MSASSPRRNRVTVVILAVVAALALLFACLSCCGLGALAGVFVLSDQAESPPQPSLAAFETADEALGRGTQRGYRARTLIDWAGAHLARGESGDRERAEELLREAEAEFEAMGAHSYSAMAQKRLGDLDMAVS